MGGEGARNSERVWRETRVAASGREKRRRHCEGERFPPPPLPLSSLPLLPSPSLSSPPPFFPLSLSGSGCGGAGLGRLRMQELGEGTRTRASSHAPSRGSREPGRDPAQRDASSGSGVRPARSRSTWILTTRQVRKGLGCWHNSSLLERPGGESLPPANQPSLVRPSNKAYIGGWGGCPVVAYPPRFLCSDPVKSGGKDSTRVHVDLTHL